MTRIIVLITPDLLCYNQYELTFKSWVTKLSFGDSGFVSIEKAGAEGLGEGQRPFTKSHPPPKNQHELELDVIPSSVEQLQKAGRFGGAAGSSKKVFS